ncbi:BRO1-like domain-containing protein [Globomyces pollinis-pini]|nr:BRO1-like domain-containing protein [Globomyces pollinis-pini]
MLKIPFKETEFLNFDPLKQAIMEIFGEDPEQYSDDFRILNSLRSSISDPQVHSESANSHLIYFAQLQFLETKFQIDEDHTKLFFTWANAFGRQEFVSSNNLGFEKASVMFNLGAVYSQLADAAGITNEDGIKKAAAYYQQAAGVYQYIMDSLPSWGITGTANTQLSALSNLMLGQAQEAFLLKAVAGKMKEGVLAKLAIQASTFYSVAHEIAKETEVFEKNWLCQMEAKKYHLAAMASLYKSTECELTGKYGERVAWLQESQSSIKSALDKSIVKYLNLNNLESELKSLSSTIDTALQGANKDNDKIYMEMVPKQSDLTPIPPARMVNPTAVPDLKALSAMITKPLFKSLVPLRIHQAASKYSFKKDNLIKSLQDKLNEATSLAQSTLASLRLPGTIEALEQPIGLPPNVLKQSEEVRNLGGPRYIDQSWATLSSFAKKDWDIVKRCLETLDNEEKEDNEMRTVHGAKWTRTPSTVLNRKLREKISEYSQKIDSADKANKIVRNKIDTNMFLIEHLGMSRKELEATIPSSTPTTTLALKDPNLKSLKDYLTQLNTNISLRKGIITRLKKLGESDDIGPRLTEHALRDQNFDEDAIFTEQFKLYESDSTAIDALITEQEKLLASIVDSNKIFMESKQTNEMIREREQALSNLDVGYKHFKDISGNLEEGIKFFSELESVLSKCETQCTDYAMARNMDRLQLKQQIDNNSYPSNVSAVPVYGNAPTNSYNYGPSHPQQNFNAGHPHQQQYQQMPQPGIWNPQQQTPQYNQMPLYQTPGAFPQQPNGPYNPQGQQPGVYQPQTQSGVYNPPAFWNNNNNTPK